MENSTVRHTEEHVVFLTTFPDAATATSAAEALLRDALIACATLLPGATSLYVWNNELTQSSEVQVLLKTRTPLLAEVTERLLVLHPYETPEVLVLPVTWGTASYLDWVTRSTTRNNPLTAKKNHPR